jgi:hypothetical protein
MRGQNFSREPCPRCGNRRAVIAFKKPWPEDRRSFPTVSPPKIEMKRCLVKSLILLVGARGFEPPTPSLPACETLPDDTGRYKESPLFSSV